MKLLLITDNHHPQGGGGAEHYFFAIKAALCQIPGLDVISLGFGPETLNTANAIVLQETQNPLKKLVQRLFFHRQTYRALSQAIKQVNPDVIHLHNYKKYSFSLLKALAGYPVVHTVHDFTPICPTYWNLHTDLQPCPTGFSAACWHLHKRDYSWPVYCVMLYWFFRAQRLLKKTVHTFLAPSPLLADYLKKQKFQTTMCLPHYPGTAKPLDYSALDTQHFLYIGQLGKHKGVALLLEEFALACKKNPALHLSIAGTGKAAKALRDQAKRLGIAQQVEFLGWVNDTQPLFKKACALILPSLLLEAFGLVTTEAMNHGRPVIGSNRGPTPWLISHGENGLLFDPLKRGDLAAQILSLARDEERIKAMGASAQARLAMLPTRDQVVAELVRVYEKKYGARLSPALSSR